MGKIRKKIGVFIIFGITYNPFVFVLINKISVQRYKFDNHHCTMYIGIILTKFEFKPLK